MGRNRLNGSYVIKVCDIADREEYDKAELLRQRCTHDFLPHLVKVEDNKIIGDKNVIYSLIMRIWNSAFFMTILRTMI